MSDDLSVLFDRSALLVEPAAGGAGPDVNDVERTLTDGYARALALERRAAPHAEERIRELAGSADHLDEVRVLRRGSTASRSSWPSSATCSATSPRRSERRA